MRGIRFYLVLLIAALGAASLFLTLWRGHAAHAVRGPHGVERAHRGKARGKSSPMQGDSSSAFASPAACEAYLAAHPRVPRHTPRIGNWNIRWFPIGSKDGHDPERRTDLDWLACAISSLDVDVLAVEEFLLDEEGHAAVNQLIARLDKLSGGRWRAEFDDCDGASRQHVGFLLDESKVELQSHGDVAALNPGPTACDRNLRPGYSAYVRFPNGPDLQLVVVHLDSGDMEHDYKNRQTSVSRIGAAAAALQRRENDADLIVLGDFNTMGCEDCAHALSAEQELEALDESFTAMGLRRVPLEDGTQCTYFKRGHPGVLDHFVVNQGMEELAADARVEVHGLCRDFECASPTRGGKRAAFEKLSDHCPTVLELSDKDLDREPLVAARALTPQ